ncbi:basic proline-rich protein-like [Ursus arctos]|uniref:basic proline-rich protein-like n=1 Tax=Ursus arctos TaxID=9644 RepID=UPI002546DEC0|nr:basic proline-rich protein-like [Ursus arctos]
MDAGRIPPPPRGFRLDPCPCTADPALPGSGPLGIAVDTSSRTRSLRIFRLYHLLVPRSRPTEPVDPQSSPFSLPPLRSAGPTAGFPVLGFLLTPSPTSPFPGDRLDPGPAPRGWGDPPPPPGEALLAGAGPAGPRGLRGRRPPPEARPPPTRSPGWRHHGPRAEPGRACLHLLPLPSPSPPLAPSMERNRTFLCPV